MALTVSPKALKDLFPTDIFFQTSFWGQVKAHAGWEPMAFDIGDSTCKGDVLVLSQPYGSGMVAAYIPQGPEFGPNPEFYGTYLEELSEKLIPHLDSKTTFIRYDLPWKSPYAEDHRDSCHPIAPEARIQEMRMNFATRSWNLRKSEVDMTVATSLVVNITGEENAILARMKSKARYNIGLSRRKGVRAFAAGRELLPAFYDLYLDTAGRNHFSVCEYDHFAALFSAFHQNHRDTEIVFLLAAHENDLLAGAIIAISGKTALYLFGASSNRKRNFMGPYAVHWEAVRQARVRGCVEYDMGAVSPGADPDHPFYGLYRFKSGFGGRIVHRTGSWDYPIDRDGYTTFRNVETVSRGL